MFVLSAGMPKSGSTLFSFYQREIIGRCFGLKGQIALEQSIVESKIPGLGHFVDPVDSVELLESLFNISESCGPFVAKTHAGPSPIIAKFVASHDVRITYIHRDPRDVILSAIDHGRRPHKNITANAFFRQFDTIEHSIPLVRQFCKTGIQWIESGLCSIFTYRDLLTDPKGLLKRFTKLLACEIDDAFYDGIVSAYTENQVKGKRQFNTGKILRFSSEMTDEEIDLCTRELDTEILRLGYS